MPLEQDQSPDRFTCWPAVQRATTAPRMPPSNMLHVNCLMPMFMTDTNVQNTAGRKKTIKGNWYNTHTVISPWYSFNSTNIASDPKFSLIIFIALVQQYFSFSYFNIFIITRVYCINRNYNIKWHLHCNYCSNKHPFKNIEFEIVHYHPKKLGSINSDHILMVRMQNWKYK